MRDPLAPAGEGWDNVTYRIGEALAVRLPRREAAVALLSRERDHLPAIAARLDVQTPVPVRTGAPGAGYPWIWNVVPWIEGDTADREPLGAGEGERLAGLLRRIHAEAPPDAPRNELRGVPLERREDLARSRFAELRGRPPEQVDRLARVWADGRATLPSMRPVWIHGDLHPRNAIVRSGVLVGIIDWGDMAAGDAATDLAAAWTLLRNRSERRAFLDAYGADAETVRRARAWGMLFGVAMSGSGEPRHEAIGQAILDQVLEEG